MRAGLAPARPASESPRRTKPRAASVTYGDLSETAAASVSGAARFLIAASPIRGIGAGSLEKKPLPAAAWPLCSGWRPQRQRVALRLGSTGKGRRHCPVQRRVPAHDVSIRMTARDGGRYRGCIPRSKNSMRIMRPPQQGQGGKNRLCRLFLTGTCGLCRWRYRAQQLAQPHDIGGAPRIGEQPVMADAVKALRQDVSIKRRMNSSVASVITLCLARPSAR